LYQEATGGVKVIFALDIDIGLTYNLFVLPSPAWGSGLVEAFRGRFFHKVLSRLLLVSSPLTGED
jgi:hypothetical protein